MGLTATTELYPSQPVATAWDSKSEDYLSRWPDMNRPLERKALEKLPYLPGDAVIHLAGVGGGREILPIVRLFPGNTIVATDISGQMVRKTQAMLDENPREFPVFLAQADLHTVPFRDVDATISLFTLHLVRSPLLALRSQWESLASGGLFAALYFPPLPLGDEGPLVSLYKAMRKLVDKPPSPWEEKCLHFLDEQGAEQVKRLEIMASWRYNSLEQIRKVFDSLPHIAGIRDRMGDAFYEELWQHFHDNPGVKKEGDSWVGPAGAVLLTARKP